MPLRFAAPCVLVPLCCLLLGPSNQAREVKAVPLTGEVRDAATKQLLPARIYVQGKDGTWHFPRSGSDKGSAVTYKKKRSDNPLCVEMHTTLSAHAFAIDLPPGEYVITVERGKEYHPETKKVTLGDKAAHVTFSLRRWIDAAKQGWYSGETHVHRPLDELPNLMLAEDLNVAFPLLYWQTEGFTPPRKAGKDPEAKVIRVDDTHVIYPRNTEYEIFTLAKKQHTLGAFFVIRHKKLFETGVPPVKPVAEQAHAEGALIELDKPNWPWSMALVPLMKVDLFELSNNHVWRTEFGFPAFGEPPPKWMKIERSEKGFTERGWLDFNFRLYYLLLNCGYRLRPTAGTASGVHPVPLGFGRVYVHLPKGFSFDDWFAGLDAGRSFVSTGPMLFVTANDEQPGKTFEAKKGGTYRLRGKAVSGVKLREIEVVRDGEVISTLKPDNRAVGEGYESPIDVSVKVESSCWLAVRCFEDRPDKRARFAHAAPWHVDVEGKPLAPRKAEVEYLIGRVEQQIERSKELLPAKALAEYREALKAYQELARKAK